MTELGNRIRSARRENKITIEKMSRSICLDGGYINKIENGIIKKPSIKNISKIANYLGLTSADLLNDSEKDILYSRYKMLNKYDKNVVMKIINALINKED